MLKFRPGSGPVQLSLLVLLAGAAAQAQLSPDPGVPAAESSTEQGTAPELVSGASVAGSGERIALESGARDEQIEVRLGTILRSTGWFEASSVRADEGVVYLEGRTVEERYRVWAGDLARHTEDVIAVVNRIELAPRSLTDLRPALDSLKALWSGLLVSGPALLVAIVVALLAYAAGRTLTWALRQSLRRRSGGGDLIRDLVARGAGLVLFTLGIYLALRLAGLTRLAATVLGGTGIIGLVLGIAFRDIAENTLASVLLARQQPFRRDDLVKIGEIEGIVQRLTVRATVLMSLDGHHVQIPNSTVYKTAIRNFTTNPARRIDFSVGIGYENSIAQAQALALSVITEHPAVLVAPEPWVLAEALESSVVQLRVYAWLDGSRYSWLKVRSALLRLVKRAFQEQGVSMPDDAREVVFPEPVTVRLLEGRTQPSTQQHGRVTPAAPTPRSEDPAAATRAEARLETTEPQLGALGRASRDAESGEDLLGRCS